MCTKVVVTALLLWSFSVLEGHALIYYMSGGGHGDSPSDSNTCVQARTITTPRATIGPSMACLSPGDTLFIRGGTYNQLISPGLFFVPSGTSEQSRITVAGYLDEYPVFTAGIAIQDNLDNSFVQYLTFNKLVLDGLADGSSIVETLGGFYTGGNTHHVRLSNSIVRNTGGNAVQCANTTHHIELVGNDIHHARVTLFGGTHPTTGNYGMYINFSDSLVEGNTIHDNTGYGIHLYSSQHYNVTNNVIRNNILYNNCTDDGERGIGLGAMIVASGDNNLAYNNLVYNNTGNNCSEGIAIGFTQQSAVNLIYNNTVFNTKGVGIVVAPDAPATVIRNNIAYGNNSGGVQIEWNGLPSQANNLTTNPQFMNSGAGNFQVQSGSAAIDAGICVTSVPTDFLGITRPQGAACDIGAYEFVSGGPGGGAVVVFCDSQEVSTGPYPCANAIDTSSTTFWHTEYVAAQPSHPHELQVDTGVENQATYGFLYQARQDGYLTGIITSFQFYVSNTTANWGAAVATGTLPYTAAPKTVGFPVKNGRYFRLVALAEGAALPYTSVAGISVLTSPPTAAKVLVSVQPSNGVSNTALPSWTVGAYDSADVLVGSYSGTVQITLGANPGLAQLLGTTNSAFVSGSHAWCCDLMLTKIGVGYTFTATSPGLTSATTTPFTITGTAPGLPTLVHAVPTP